MPRQYRFEQPKLYYHPWLAADESRVSHVLSHVVWWKRNLEATPHKAAAIRPPTTHHENYQN